MNGRILLIDDDRFARRLYGDFLAAGGFEVELATTGEEAIARVTPGRFDVVVTDLLLPGIDGLGVLAEVRHRDPDAGVVVITALDMVAPAVRAIKGGAFDYLIKPVTAEALNLSVQRCLDWRRLLRHNADLRRHLALTQTASRVSAAGDPRTLWRLTAESLVDAAGARLAVVIERRTPAAPVLLRAAGADLPDPWAFEALVASALDRLDAGAVQVPLPALETPGGALGPGLALPLARAAGRTLAALLYPGADDDAEGIDAASATFVLGHAASALATVERLRRAERLAFVDDLTQLFNARYLSRVLDRHLEGDGLGQPPPFAVLFIDLDRFKDVNDTHGHVVGSGLLAEVGRVLQATIRDTDVPVRYGGDEYVVVLPDTGPEAAMHVAERIRRRIGDHVFLAREARSLRITASVGVACFPDHATEKDALLDLADRAMYRGKRGTRNSVYLATV